MSPLVSDRGSTPESQRAERPSVCEALSDEFWSPFRGYCQSISALISAVIQSPWELRKHGTTNCVVWNASGTKTGQDGAGPDWA